MNKIELDFNLESTTPQVFWNLTYEWICKYKLLTPAAHSEFALKFMQLSNFTVTLPGKHDGKVLIDVYHDTFSKNIEITVEYECSTTKKTVEILFDYFEGSWFSYKESVENEEYEGIDIPDFPKRYGRALWPPSLRMPKSRPCQRPADRPGYLPRCGSPAPRIRGPLPHEEASPT